MKSWEFRIESREDLKPFHDLLLEEGNPGAKVVMDLIQQGKWPTYQPKRVGSWQWLCNRQNHEIKGRNRLPFGILPGVGWKFFWSANHAIWAVIDGTLHKHDGGERR